MTLTFTAPGKGTWLRFLDHFPLPITPEYESVIIEALDHGNRDVAERYGIPLATLQLATVHGLVYLRPVPLIGSGAKALPPRSLLWLGSRLHPKLRACARAAERALIERPWLAVAEEWATVGQPAWEARLLALQAVDPGGLDDAALAAHLVACRDTWHEGYRLHFRLHGSDLQPTCVFVVSATRWGLERDECLAALTGWSGASTGDDVHLQALRAAIATEVAAGAPRPLTLEDVHALKGRVPATLNAYLARHAWRMVTSYDLDGRALGELPNVLLSRVLSRPPAGDVVARRAEADRVADKLRARVPAADRDRFDVLLADARATYGLRDANGPYLGSWPVGLTRRALLVAGRRLAATNRLHEPGHVFELLVDETASLLRGAPGPDATEAAARARRRNEAAALADTAPNVLGPRLGSPDTSVLPEAMAVMTAAQLLLAADSGMTDDKPATVLPTGGSVLHGTGVGEGVVEAVVRVFDDPIEAMDLLEPGELIVTASTNPAWNAVLPLAAGLVVEEGGALSHAAIIARELDLPTVIGVAGATRCLTTGSRAVIDAGAGTVRSL